MHRVKASNATMQPQHNFKRVHSYRFRFPAAARCISGAWPPVGGNRTVSRICLTAVLQLVGSSFCLCCMRRDAGAGLDAADIRSAPGTVGPRTPPPGALLRYGIDTTVVTAMGLAVARGDLQTVVRILTGHQHQQLMWRFATKICAAQQ